jgi:hypothetical protein
MAKKSVSPKEGSEMDSARKIEEGFFTPALQMAFKKSGEAGHDGSSILNGVVSAHLNMLVSILGGYRPAAVLVQGQLEYLLKLAEAEEAEQKEKKV